MYQYIHYTRDRLLQSIDQIKIWHSIVGYCQLGEFILNPLRVDNHKGSCSLIEYQGRIILQDWASKKHSGADCISAYCTINPHKTWQEVCTNLLELSKGFVPTSAYVAIPGLVKKSKTLELIPIYREWQIRDKEYWGKRGITKSQLERDNLVRPIQGYIQIKEDRKSEQHFNELAYCYHYEERVKFYFPERKEFRFLGNINRNDTYFINKGSSTILITKSLKDMLVLDNLTSFNLLHIQSENSDPDGHIILDWEFGHKDAILFYDNDNAGIEGMKRLASKFLYLEPSLFWINPDTGFKDIDEMRSNWGEKDTIEYLQTYLLNNDNT